MIHHLTTPLTSSTIQSLHAGDRVLLSGVIYTARDAAHKRLCALIAAGKSLPVDLRDQIVYYVGPTPAQPGHCIGSAGPTTAGRMDAYAPILMERAGIKGMIAKGNRSPVVIASMRKYGCAYFAATGGAGALLSKCIRSSSIVCYEDLGPEAIYRLEIENFPCVVAIDVLGENLYVEGPQKWRR